MWPMILVGDVYESLTASASFREAKRLYERARHDEAQALYNAAQKAWEEERQKGIEIGIKQVALEAMYRMFHAGLPLNQIAELCNLPLQEVEALRADWSPSQP